MCQASTCGRVLALAWVQVLKNSASQMAMLRFTTLSARDCHWQNPRKKNYRECSNIKSTRVSALTGSLRLKMAEARQSISTVNRNWTHVACFSATSLNHWAIDSYQNLEIKWYMNRSISPPATDFFGYRTVVLGFFNLNIKARHEIREFLNANLWSIHLIALDIDWSWKIFT